jgi:restriction system protein
MRWEYRQNLGGKMAKTINSGLLHDRMELPWWVAVVFAATIYAFLKWIFPSIAGSGVFLKSLAATAQSLAGLLAAIFLALGGLSRLLAFRRRRVLDLEMSLATIRALPQRRFEQFATEAFEKQGYSVAQCDSAGPDCGEFILTRGNEKVLVQCRRWRSESIDSVPVRELYEAMAAAQASSCALLTTGDYSDDARRFAAGKRIQLVAGRELEKMLSGGKRAVNSAKVVHAHDSPIS